MVHIDRAKLRRSRQLSGMTQAELAARANISFGYVGHLERGTRASVSPRVFVRLCDALAVQDRTELLAQDENRVRSL